MPKDTRLVAIDYCARCGMDHGDVRFRRFKGNPISSDGYDFEFWGWCPTFLEPIILRVDEDEECKDGTLCKCSPECKDTECCTDK